MQVCTLTWMANTPRERTLLFAVSRDISEHKQAESEIRQLNTSLEKRVAERTVELVQSNDKLTRAKEELRTRSDQVQKHRDVLLELAHSDKSDFKRALQKICSLSAATLNVARVSYWSVEESDSAISCEVLYLRDTDGFDSEFKGSRLGFADYPTYFEDLAANRPIVANHVVTHPPRPPWRQITSTPLAFLRCSTRRFGNALKVSGCFATNISALLATGRRRKSTLSQRSARWCHSPWKNLVERARKSSCAKARPACAKARNASAQRSASFH